MKEKQFRVSRDDWDSIMLDHQIPLDLHPHQQCRELYDLAEIEIYDTYPEFKEAAALAIWAARTGKYPYYLGEYVMFSPVPITDEIVPKAEKLNERREAWEIFAPGVHANPYSRKFLAGMILAELGLNAGVTDDGVRMLDIASNVPLPEESRKTLREAWHVINGYEYYKRMREAGKVKTESEADTYDPPTEEN